MNFKSNTSYGFKDIALKLIHHWKNPGFSYLWLLFKRLTSLPFTTSTTIYAYFASFLPLWSSTKLKTLKAQININYSAFSLQSKKVNKKITTSWAPSHSNQATTCSHAAGMHDHLFSPCHRHSSSLWSCITNRSQYTYSLIDQLHCVHCFNILLCRRTDAFQKIYINLPTMWSKFLIQNGQCFTLLLLNFDSQSLSVLWCGKIAIWNRIKLKTLIPLDSFKRTVLNSCFLFLFFWIALDW